MIVDVAFYLKLGFGRQRHGFESGSWFLGDRGLSPHLSFLGDVGLNPHLCFLGVGRVFLIWFCLGGGGGFTLIS